MGNKKTIFGIIITLGLVISIYSNEYNVTVKSGNEDDGWHSKEEYIEEFVCR